MANSEFGVYTGTELLNTPTVEDRYLIDGILWEKDHAFLLGKEKSGKSILSLQMACALSAGAPFLGKYEVPEQMVVLYVQAEGKKHDTVERLKQMTNERGVAFNPENFYLLYCKSVSLDTPVGLDEFKKIVQAIPKKPQVIFLDPLYMSMEGDLIDNTDARDMVRNMRNITDTFDCTLVIVHHQHRPQRDKSGTVIQEDGDENIFGSFVWKAFADHVLSLYVRKDKVRLLSCFTQRTSKVLENIELALIHEGTLHFEVLGEDQKPYVKEVYGWMCGHVKPSEGITADGIHSAMGFSESAVRKSLSILIREGSITVVNPGRRPLLYTPVLVESHKV